MTDDKVKGQDKKEKDMSIIALGTAAATKKVVDKIVADMYEAAKNELGKKIKRWKTEAQIDSLYKKLKNVRMVKTIIQPEKPVDLASFYCPTKIQLDDEEETRITISDLNDLPFDGNVAIQGTVGQGKSIFMRYLVSRELMKGSAIPVFVELRRIKAGQTLLTYLLQELKSLDLEMDEPLFDFFAKKGKIKLFLDAFDEVAEEQRADLIREIESFNARFPELRVIVSTRPNTGIDSSPFFAVFNMAYLNGKEYETVVSRMSNDPQTAQNIIEGVKKDQSRVVPLLTTPLMVALLIVRYKVEQTIPQNAVAFYQSLFMLLLQRHDKSKGGYVRPRKSDVGDSTLEEIFNAFCFITRKKDKRPLMRQDVRSYMKESLVVVGQNCDADKALADIVEITCLLLCEGDEFRFIHRSVLEYHAALFIQTRPDAAANKFYEAMGSRWQAWNQELEFLLSIDKYRCFQQFHIQKLRAILNLDAPCPPDWQPTVELVMQTLGGDRIGFRDGRIVAFRYSANSWTLWPLQHIFSSDSRSDYFAVLFRIDPKPLTNLETETEFDQDSEDYESISLNDIYKAGLYHSEIFTAGRSVLLEIRDELVEAEQFIKLMDETRKVLEF